MEVVAVDPAYPGALEHPVRTGLVEFRTEEILDKRTLDSENADKQNITPPFKSETIDPPGVEEDMQLKPRYIHENYKGSEKLKDKTALVTGGDSGIGRAICLHYATEGADVAFTYTKEEKADASYTEKLIESCGRKALAIEVDFSQQQNYQSIVKATVDDLDKIDILVNNAAFQNHVSSSDDLSFDQFKKTFEVNVFGTFQLIKACLPHMNHGGCIINTSSILGYVGDDELIDYSATKAAIRSMTKSFSKDLKEKDIRVNSVAPGPVWTPLNPAERKAEDMKTFGKGTDFGRPAQPAEVAPAYVFLASEVTGGYITGETINIFGSASGAN